MLDWRYLQIVDWLVDIPLLYRGLQVGVFPEFDFSVLSTSNKILTIFIDIQGIYGGVMGSDGGLASAKVAPYLNESIPANSNEVVVLWIGGDSKLGNSICMSRLS